MATLLDDHQVESEQGQHNVRESKIPASTPKSDEPKVLGMGFLFGVLFGFLLQKGGVAKFHILIGQLLLEDFTVIQVMLSAVIVGTLGIHLMHARGWVELHIKPTRYASNVIGGLLFGIGFACSAYCPGTGAAALGQGNLDAIAMIFGMIIGSYVFAEASGWISKNVDTIGDRGKITLHDWLPWSRTTVTVASAILLSLLLVVIGLL